MCKAVKVRHNGKDSLVVTAHKTKIFTKFDGSSLELSGNSWRVRLGFWFGVGSSHTQLTTICHILTGKTTEQLGTVTPYCTQAYYTTYL